MSANSELRDQQRSLRIEINPVKFSVTLDARHTNTSRPSLPLSLFVVKQFRENLRCKYRTAGLRFEIEIPLWRRGLPSSLNGRKYEGDCYWKVFLHLTLSLLFCLLYVSFPSCVRVSDQILLLLLPSIASTSHRPFELFRHFWTLREYISHLPRTPRAVRYCVKNFVWTNATGLVTRDRISFFLSFSLSF